MNTLLRSFSIFLVGATTAGMLIMPGASFAQENNKGDNNSDRKESHMRDSDDDRTPPGHYIAPGLRGKIDLRMDESICKVLPKGIVKKLVICSKSDEQPDTTAPEINNISVVQVSANSAKIKWSTDEKINSSVYYSVVSGFKIGDNNVSIKTREKNEVELHNLAADTTYYFIIRAEDKSGNVSVTTQHSFRTLVSSPDDNIAPIVSDVAVSGITKDSATVTWKTNEPATSIVWYRTQPNVFRMFLTSARNSDLVTSHSLTLTGLQSGAKYYFVAGGRDASGNLGYSSEGSFITTTTPDTTAPVILDASVSGITDHSVILNTRTNEPVTTKVVYGIKGSTALSTVTSTVLETNASFALTGLSANTEYQVKVTVTDKSGNVSTSADVNWTTKVAVSDTVPPQIVNISTETNLLAKTAMIHWFTSESSDSTIRYSKISDLSASGTTVVHSSAMVQNHELKIVDLEVGALYYFTVESKDSAGNIGVSSKGLISL